MKKIIEISAIDMTIYKFVLPLMKEIQNNGWEVCVAANDSGYQKKLCNMGYKVYPISFSRGLSPIKNIKAFFELIKLFKMERPECIHVHTPIASVLARLAGRLTKVPRIIYTLHGLYKKPFFLTLEKIACKYWTDYIFTVNQEDMDYLIDKRFISSDKIKNINSVGIDTEVFSPEAVTELQKQEFRKNLEIKNKPVIGFVGRLVYEKGIVELLEAFIRVREKYDCQLLLIGSAELNERDKKTFGKINQLIYDTVYKDDIILAGHRDDIPLCTSVMDIFVLPSHREGMPISSLEAMAMEKPVILSEVRGARQEIEDGKTGKIIPINDIDSLYNALVFFLENNEIGINMGKEARKRVLNNFTVELSVSRQMEIFK